MNGHLTPLIFSIPHNQISHSQTIILAQSFHKCFWNDQIIYLMILFQLSVINNIKFWSMGNKACICCEDLQQNNQDPIDIDILKPKKEQDHLDISNKVENSINENLVSNDEKQKVQQILPVQQIPVTKPQLSNIVRANLQKYSNNDGYTIDPFSDKLSKSPVLKKYDNDIYEGQINQKNQPHGYGTMYYPSGAVFIGSFVNGVANGEAHYILANGSFYKGKMKENKAEDENGYFESQNLVYQGGVRNNKFEGKGRQTGEMHVFEGSYTDGRRVEGTLKWRQEEQVQKTEQNPLEILGGSSKVQKKSQKQQFTNEYTGNFNEKGLFAGKATLKCKKGQYSGDFIDGRKSGKGTFKFANGLSYEGTYKNDIKQGTGTIYTKFKKIAYSGEFKNGMPHGRGFVMGKNDEKIEMDWNEGISNKVQQGQSKDLRRQISEGS